MRCQLHNAPGSIAPADVRFSWRWKVRRRFGEEFPYLGKSGGGQGGAGGDPRAGGTPAKRGALAVTAKMRPSNPAGIILRKAIFHMPGGSPGHGFAKGALHHLQG